MEGGKGISVDMRRVSAANRKGALGRVGHYQQPDQPRCSGGNFPMGDPRRPGAMPGYNTII